MLPKNSQQKENVGFSGGMKKKEKKRVIKVIKFGAVAAEYPYCHRHCSVNQPQGKTKIKWETI